MEEKAIRKFPFNNQTYVRISQTSSPLSASSRTLSSMVFPFKWKKGKEYPVSWKLSATSRIQIDSFSMPDAKYYRTILIKENMS